MTQSRLDSLMEALTNTFIGLVVSTIANHFIIPATLGVQMTIQQNLLLAVLFTIISIARSYVLRRLFNGKSAWAAMKGRFA